MKHKRMVVMLVPFAEHDKCPHCGADVDGSNCFDSHSYEPSIGVSMNSGPWDAASWIEVHECHNCEGLYEVEGRNY